jgi:predicted enzyme related to lactoylglutathione lyase
MNPRAVDYVFYGVADWEKGVAFYRDTLGLKLELEVPDIKWAEFNVGGTTLAVAGPPYGEAPQPDYKGGATVAISVADAKATMQELKEKGVTINWGPDETPSCWIGGISDPEGNKIIIHQRTDGTAG